MNVKATFPAGVTKLVAHGLHQWDYGQQLEIEYEGAPAAIEVHFAYAGLRDAFVRTCAVINGKATVSIPDKCLEQTTPITAWVYEIEGARGTTTKTITLPVIQRARPKAGDEVPTEYIDKYAEALTAMNEIVEDLQNGEVAVKNATGVTINGKAPFQEPTETVEALSSSGYYCIIATQYNSSVQSFFCYWYGVNPMIIGQISIYNDYLIVAGNGSLTVWRNGTTEAPGGYVTDQYTFNAVKLWG
jgi:hypothetical protein